MAALDEAWLPQETEALVWPLADPPQATGAAVEQLAWPAAEGQTAGPQGVRQGQPDEVAREELGAEAPQAQVGASPPADAGPRALVAVVRGRPAA